MKDKLAFLAYKYLVKYCKHKSKNNSCNNCVFNDDRPRCMCIANIPTEWYEPIIK